MAAIASQTTSSIAQRKTDASDWFRTLRDEICAVFETIEDAGRNDDEIGSMIAGLGANVDLAWLANLAVAMPSGSAALLAQRLRLSRVEERCLTRLDLGLGHDGMTMLSGARWRQAVYYLGDMTALLFAVQSWRNGHVLDASRLAEFTLWTPPQNPICGTDLLSHGVDNGPSIGQLLEEAERLWVSSNFTLGKAALLDRLIGN